MLSPPKWHHNFSRSETFCKLQISHFIYPRKTNWQLVPHLRVLNYKTDQHTLSICCRLLRVGSYTHHCCHHTAGLWSTQGRTYKQNNQRHYWSCRNTAYTCHSNGQSHFLCMNILLSQDDKSLHLNQGHCSCTLQKQILRCQCLSFAWHKTMSSNATILGFHVTSRRPYCMVYRTIAKKFLWEFDSNIMQNLSDILPLFCTPIWPSHHGSENQEY